MTLISPLQQRLTFLVLVLSFVCCSPGLVHSSEIYRRVYQTDADFDPEQIRTLVEKLDDKLDVVRYPAYFELQRLGPKARPALEKLIDTLDEESVWFEPETFQEFASATLAAMGPDALDRLRERFPEESTEAKLMIARTIQSMKADAQPLLPGLRDECLRTVGIERREILELIVTLDETGETAIPLLLKSIQNQEEESERESAARWLSRHQKDSWGDPNPSLATRWFIEGKQDTKPVVDQLLKRLADRSGWVQVEAAQSLSSYPEHEDQIVPALLGLLYVSREERSGLMSYVTAKGLADFPKSAELTVPAIVKWTDLDDEKAIEGAQQALAKLIPLTKDPVEHVKTLLASEHPERALLTLARMGPAAQPMIADIEPLAKNAVSDNYLNTIPMQALLTVGCIDQKRQPDTIKMLNQVLYNWEEAFFLEQVGENAAFGAPFVEKLLRDSFINEYDDESQIRWLQSVVRFLARNGHYSPEMRSRVFKYLMHDPDHYDEMIQLLVQHFPETIPSQFANLRDLRASTSQQITALQFLGAIHADDPELIPLVIAHLESHKPALRESAVQALGEIGVKNVESEQALLQALSDPRVRVRAKALDSLAQFGEKAGPVIPHIIECLSDEYLTVRVAAVRCLAELGTTAAPAIDDLEKLKDSQSLLLRETAEEALQSIPAAVGEMK